MLALVSAHATGRLMHQAMHFEVRLLQRLLNRSLTDKEWTALQSAHLVGLQDFIANEGYNSGAKTFRLIDRRILGSQYKDINIAIQKTRESILIHAGFSEEEIKTIQESYGALHSLPGFKLKGMAVLGRELTDEEAAAVEQQSLIGEYVIIGASKGPVRIGYTKAEKKEKRKILQKVFTPKEMDLLKTYNIYHWRGGLS